MVNIVNPNILINGDFQVWQRGISFNKVTTNSYFADMWNVGMSISSPNDTPPTISKSDSGINIAYGSTKNITMTQFLEKYLIYNENYTLTIGVGGDIYSYNIIGGTSFSSAVTPFLNIDYEVFNNPGGTRSYDCISFTLTSSMTINFVKLERGTKFTGNIPRRYDEELRLCQRYYYKLPYGQYVCGSDSGGSIYIHDPWIINNMAGTSRSIINGITSSCGLKYNGIDSGGTIKQMGYAYNAIQMTFNEVAPISTTVYFYYGSENQYIGVEAYNWY